MHQQLECTRYTAVLNAKRGLDHAGNHSRKHGVGIVDNSVVSPAGSLLVPAKYVRDPRQISCARPRCYAELFYFQQFRPLALATAEYGQDHALLHHIHPLLLM